MIIGNDSLKIRTPFDFILSHLFAGPKDFFLQSINFMKGLQQKLVQY